MASSYKTPGVYVEEITKLPPSVAEVDTAIPAFVGYTEKAKRFVEDDLLKIPTRIKSLLEYENYFGKGPSYSTLHVQMNANSAVDDEKTTVANSIYNLYESMRLFFDNGGGVCYITAAGKYSDGHDLTTRATKLTEGLAEIRKFDEPTLLLFPDAVNLKDNTGAVDGNKLAGIQQMALKQCGDLGDRFAIFDVPDEGNKTVEEEAESFRSKVGMNNLKYGAAYAPFLKTIYDKTFRLRDIMNNFFDNGGSAIELKSLFADSDKDAAGTPIKTKLDDFKKIYQDNDAMKARLALFSGKLVTDAFDTGNVDTRYQALAAVYKSAPDDAGRIAALKTLFEFVFETFSQLEGLTTAHAAQTDATTAPSPVATKPIRTALINNATMRTAAEGFLGTNMKTSLQTFKNLDFEAYRAAAASDVSNTPADKPGIDFALFTTAGWLPGAGVDATLISGATPTDKLNATFSQLGKVYASAKSGLNSAVGIGAAFEDTVEKALIPDLAIYNSIVKVLNTKVNTLPPSGAVAGIYASVDRDRGVWKAPANVTINSVSDVSEPIDDITQDGMNVDPTAGKSINAIRPFYGKGIMVWGSRTLAGNDNEWRYVPVRRLFNFVEESCKKSTAWSVFEPNDANTWARVRSQIDNFLNNLWRRGALAGAKPEHAYYVNCGLGITMIAQDILEGRLIIEIGMAAVRPAEFVILKFSHKLQQS
jgi:phage tail sheath protein FI